MLTYKSLQDHAVAMFSGDVDWTSVCELTDLVDTLVERHFQTHIELVIASPGGAVAALDHYLECTGRWRARGVRLRTRVVSHAFSAAAVMLSLGDERVAGRGSPRSSATGPERERPRRAQRCAAGAILSPCASSTPQDRCARTTTTAFRRWSGWM